MLKRILDELKASDGPIDLPELSRRLGVERSALDGMLMQLVRLGKLREVSSKPPDCARCVGCSVGCATTSGGKAYAVVEDDT